MHAVRRWRPAGRSDMRWVGRRVEDTLRPWFERWVAVPTDGKVSVTYGKATCGSRDGRWWCADEHICLRVVDQIFFDGLVLPSLDVPQNIQVDQGVDRELITRLHDAMISDLLTALSDGMAQQGHTLTFRPNASVSHGRPMSHAIEVRCSLASGKPWLEIWIEPSWLTESLRTRPPGPGCVPPVSIQQAVLDSRVEIKVNLGSCALSARELRDLSVGDVLRIDQDLNTGVSLELRRDSDATAQALGTGTAGEYRGNAAISITHIYSDPRP